MSKKKERFYDKFEEADRLIRERLGKIYDSADKEMFDEMNEARRKLGVPEVSENMKLIMRKEKKENGK